MGTLRYLFVVGLAVGTSAFAQHPVPPTTVNGMYDMTTFTPIVIGSCSGEGIGCTSVNGMDWLADGRMVLLTTDYIGHGPMPYSDSTGTARRPRSKVSLISGFPNGPLTTTTIASHFRQPTGVLVVNDTIWVGDMDSVFIITNLNPTPADTLKNRTGRFRTPNSNDHGGTGFQFPSSTCYKLFGHINSGACTNQNSKWHHYVFPPVYYQGKIYAAYGGATLSGNGTSNLPSSSYYAGALLMWDRNTSSLDTTANRAAGGLRSPNGTALGPGGTIFVTDHQGSFLPMSTLTPYKANAPKMQYGGYRQDPGYKANWGQDWYDRGLADYVPPVAINRFDQSGKNGWVGIAQAYWLTQGHYAGQMLVGDINSRGITRVAFDTLSDTTGAENFQGAVFYFTPGNSGNTLGTGNSGINRITQGPDGTIYAGGGRGVGNWAGGAGPHLIYVFKPDPSPDQFEIMKIRSLSNGYELYLSQKVDPSTVTTGNFTVGQRNWVRQSAYGMGFSPANNPNSTTGTPQFTSRSVTAVAVSDDSLRIQLVVSGIQRINQSRRGDSVTHWHTRFLFSTNLKSSSGTTIYTTEADYAQNWISNRSWDPGGGVTAVRGARAKGMLANNIWLTPEAGLLRVNVDNMSLPYRITLRDLKGRELFRKNDIPPNTRATEVRAPGSIQGVYILEIQAGRDIDSRIVTF